MITHFQFQPLFSSEQIPGWRFSFYYQKLKFTGLYHKDGQIEWLGEAPDGTEEELLKKQIHELMLFHVYDK